MGLVEEMSEGLLGDALRIGDGQLVDLGAEEGAAVAAHEEEIVAEEGFHRYSKRGEGADVNGRSAFPAPEQRIQVARERSGPRC